MCLSKPLHSAKFTKRAWQSSKGIIRPLLRKETINSFRYIEILQQIVATFEALANKPENSWFMQDGTELPRTNVVFNFLESHYFKIFSNHKHWCGLFSMLTISIKIHVICFCGAISKTLFILRFLKRWYSSNKSFVMHVYPFQRDIATIDFKIYPSFEIYPSILFLRK